MLRDRELFRLQGDVTQICESPREHGRILWASPEDLLETLFRLGEAIHQKETPAHQEVREKEVPVQIERAQICAQRRRCIALLDEKSLALRVQVLDLDGVKSLRLEQLEVSLQDEIVERVDGVEHLGPVNDRGAVLGQKELTQNIGIEAQLVE